MSTFKECGHDLFQSHNRSRHQHGDRSTLTFIEGDLQAPKHLAGVVHDLYFNPKYEGFQPRTMWSLSNAFTSAFKELEPIPQFKATAKLGGIPGSHSRNRGLGAAGALRYVRVADAAAAGNPSRFDATA